jgi:hypothetical protein
MFLQGKEESAVSLNVLTRKRRIYTVSLNVLTRKRRICTVSLNVLTRKRRIHCKLDCLIVEGKEESAV